MKRIISIFLCIILLCGVWGCTKKRDVTSSDASLSTSQGVEQVQSGESSAQESGLHNTSVTQSASQGGEKTPSNVSSPQESGLHNIGVSDSSTTKENKPAEEHLKTIRVENQNLHMQGFTSDKENMYFSFTDSLVKTNSAGTVEKQVPVGGGHLGDIDYYNGKIYGSFMKEPLKGRPWYEWTGFELYVFDAKTLALEKSVNLDVCDNYFSVLGTAGDTRGFNGIDGITIAPDPVTGKDKIFIACSTDSNEKYKNQILLQFSLDGKYEKEHYIPTGNTVYGIQNLDYDAQAKEFWFSTYAPENSYQPKEMLYCVSGDLKTIKAKYEFFTGYGIDCLGNNRYYVSYEFGVNGDKGGEARLCDRKSFS